MPAHMTPRHPLTLRARACALVVLAATMLALVGAAPASAAGSGPPAGARAGDGPVVFEGGVYLTRGEHLVTARRRAVGPSALDAALGALFAGPTPAEARRGLRSSIPAAARLRASSVDGGVATVDVSGAFASGPPRALPPRMVQLVFTATAVRGVDRVRIRIDGTTPERLGGVALDPPLTRATFAPAPSGGPEVPKAGGAPSALVRGIQARLIALGYLPPGAGDGIAGPQTRHAVLAFQGWHGLRRSGVADMRLKRSLDRARRPAAGSGPSRRIEVRLRRQVALVLEGGRVVRTIHVSTGKASSPTPPGRFRVFRKELRSWSYPFQVWLPYASYFNAGIAFHEGEVPTFPASAGCVRVPRSDAPFVYAFATVGTPVIVRRS